MSWLSDRLKEALPYATVALPFTPWGAVLKGMQPEWMQGIMKSKFMSSILGAGLKDAGLKYALATAQGKRNPHIIAKDALLRNMFTNAYKVGFDPNLMMGGDKTIPATFGKFSDKMEGPIPAEWESRVTPAYREYGQSMMDKWYGPGRGGPNIAPSPYDVTTGYGDIVPERLFPSDPLAEATFGKRSLIPDIADAPMPLTYKISDEIPGGISDRVSEKDFGSAILKKSTEENPLAGMGYMTTTKTEPSMLDRLLGKVKEAKELEIERGSDEWNEMFDIGATRPDSAWLAGTMYDWFRDPLTDAQIKQKEQEDYEERMRRLMWPRSMADVPDFQKSFLGLNKGGIASLSNGGMGPGPYSNPYPDDDSNIDVQDIIQGPGFESIDELGALFGDPDEMAAAPHPMEGWYDMFFDTFGRYPNNEAELIEFINESDVDVPAVAQGGRIGMYGGGDLNAIPGGMVSGPGTETSDSIPAQLSNNEFVFTADAVRAAGGGDIDLGAQKFYGIMNALDPNSAKPGEPPVYS